MTELIHSRQAVRECLRAGRRKVRKLLLAQGIKETDILAEITTLARDGRIPLQILARRELDRASGGANHQGIAAEVSSYPYSSLEAILARGREDEEAPLLLLLDCLQDPQNLGSLLRTAEAVGAHGVLIPKRRAVGISPTVVNASAGAVEHLLVAQVTNMVRTIKELKAQGLWICGLENVPEAERYDRADLTGSLALVVGSEGRGLRRLVRENCDFLIKLPIRGQVGSLNAAVAGSIALYEVWRQRQGSNPPEKPAWESSSQTES